MCVALFLVACLWELYKAIGPEEGGDLLGIPLAKTNDRAMPHTWDMVDAPRAAGEPRRRPGDLAFGGGVRLVLVPAGGVRLALGAIFGIAAAVVMSRFRFVERGLLPWIVMSQTVPLIALAPQVVSWSGKIDLFGWGWPRWLSVCTLAAFLAFFPISVGTLRGLASAPAAAIELMQSYAAGWWRTLFKLRFPAAVPSMVPAFKLAATLSVVGVIVSEISTGVQRGHRARRHLVQPGSHR